MPRIRPRNGVVIRTLPFGGAFAVDRAALAAVEIDGGLARWLADPTADQPAQLGDAIAGGVSDGWLVVDEPDARR